MKFIALSLLLFNIGCATWNMTPLERKRHTVLECVKDLKGYDTNTKDAFDVCKNVYYLNETN